MVKEFKVEYPDYLLDIVFPEHVIGKPFKEVKHECELYNLCSKNEDLPVKFIIFPSLHYRNQKTKAEVFTEII